MSFYNLMHGVDPNALRYLQALSIPKESIARFRDCHLSGDGTRILLLTRTGGGNRKDYGDFIRQMQQHPNYLRDYDDDFDSTFCYFEFHVPEFAQAICEALATGQDPPTLKEKTDRLHEELNAMTPEQLGTDPRTKDFVEFFKGIANGLTKKEE